VEIGKDVSWRLCGLYRAYAVNSINRRLKVRIRDATGCKTGCTTGCVMCKHHFKITITNLPQLNRSSFELFAANCSTRYCVFTVSYVRKPFRDRRSRMQHSKAVTSFGIFWWAGTVEGGSGAERPGFKSQSRRCRVTVLGKLFTPIVPLFT